MSQVAMKNVELSDETLDGVNGGIFDAIILGGMAVAVGYTLYKAAEGLGTLQETMNKIEADAEANKKK